MKKFLLALFVCLLSLNLGIGEAEAARLGGGKSVGIQRQLTAPRPATPAQQAAPAPRPAPAGTPAPATPSPARNWLGPIAGLAAGLGIAALFSHLGMGAGLANMLTLGLLVMGAVLLFRMFFRRNAPTPPQEAMQYAGMTPAARPPIADDLPQMPASAPGAAPQEADSRIPADFDSAAFLRVAKLNFVRLQAANDAKNLDDIREFVSPEMFAEIKLQIDERGNAPQQTDIVTLNAEVLEVVTEGKRHIVSVHFSGMIREAANAAAAPFGEIWNLSKPVEGNSGWVIAGIQQIA